MVKTTVAIAMLAGLLTSSQAWRDAGSQMAPSVPSQRVAAYHIIRGEQPQQFAAYHIIRGERSELADV